MANATTALTVPGDDTLASRSVNSDMPCVFSSTPMSTVTPQTISTTPHGMRLMASFSSPALSSDRIVAPTSAAIPTCRLKRITPSTTAASTPMVSQCRASNGSATAASAPSPDRCEVNSFQPPKSR